MSERTVKRHPVAEVVTARFVEFAHDKSEEFGDEVTLTVTLSEGEPRAVRVCGPGVTAMDAAQLLERHASESASVLIQMSDVYDMAQKFDREKAAKPLEQK